MIICGPLWIPGDLFYTERVIWNLRFFSTIIVVRYRSFVLKGGMVNALAVYVRPDETLPFLSSSSSSSLWPGIPARYMEEGVLLRM